MWLLNVFTFQKNLLIIISWTLCGCFGWYLISGSGSLLDILFHENEDVLYFFFYFKRFFKTKSSYFWRGVVVIPSFSSKFDVTAKRLNMLVRYELSADYLHLSMMSWISEKKPPSGCRRYLVLGQLPLRVKFFVIKMFSASKLYCWIWVKKMGQFYLNRLI